MINEKILNQQITLVFHYNCLIVFLDDFINHTKKNVYVKCLIVQRFTEPAIKT